MKKIWKDIPSYENLYQVSNLGNIKSLINNRGNYREMILTPSVRPDGYLTLTLSKNNKKKRYLVHRLILETFIGPCPVGMQCRHLDGDSSNNKLENLKWGSPKENQADRIIHGTSNRGSRCSTAKLNEWKVRVIKRLLEDGYLTQTEIASIFNVSRRTISHINAGDRWNCK